MKPRQRLDRKKVEAAKKLYRDFSGEEPQGEDVVALKVPQVGLVVGECEGVLYTTVRDGEVEKYIHKFKRSSRPLLVASHDGKQLFLIGGKFIFTDRGIVDK